MHVDLDAFFVEVCRRHDPALERVELLIVGGRRNSRGVVQSASYGARAFGVRSGMPIGEAARRCPEATFVKGEFACDFTGKSGKFEWKTGDMSVERGGLGGTEKCCPWYFGPAKVA